MNSTQKNYIRKANYESVKAADKKSDMAPSPYQMNLGNYSQLNTKMMNLINSPNKEIEQHQGYKSFINFMNEEEHQGQNAHPNEFPPYGFQMIGGTTPPMLKPTEGNRIHVEDPFSAEKFANFLTHSNQEKLNVFTFPPSELKAPENMNMNMNMMPNFPNFGGENENNSAHKNSFWGHQLNHNTNFGKQDFGFQNGLFGNRQPSFDGFMFNDERFDFNERFNQMKM